MPRLPEALGTPQDFGDNAGQSVDQIPDVQDRLSRAAAEQDFISHKLDLDQQFAADTDYATAPQRYRQALLQGLNDTSQSVAAPAQRADFQQQMSGVAAAGVDSIFRQSVAKARDAGRASVAQAASVAVNDALRTTDETDLNPIFNAFNDRVQASLEAGYLSPEEAVALRKSTAQSYVSQRGWRLADADPQQAVDTLSPTETSADGQPAFAKTGDWRDFLDPGDRASMAQRAQQNLEAQQRAAKVDAVRQQRQQQKADTDAAQAIAACYVAPLLTDPTGVDINALARERFPDSQQDTRQALLGAAQTAIAQSGDQTATGYGSGFWQAFNRVTAADGDPSKIADPVELYKLAGPEGGGALTMTGVRELQRYLDASGTVEGRAQNAMEQSFLSQAHAAITGTQDVADPAAEARFQNFLGAYFPALKDGLASGKSAMQLLSAAGSDYLGKLVPAFTPSASPSQPDQNTPGTVAAAASDRRDKDIETLPDNRSFWDRLGDVARSWSEERQAQLQNVDPVLTRRLAPRLGSLGEDDAGVIIVPDSRGTLDKTIRFDPTKHVILGNDIYERVAEAEESPRLSGARAFLGGLGPGPVGVSRAAAGIKAGEAADQGARAAEEAATEAGGTRAAEASGTAPALRGNTAAPAGSSWVSRVPSAEEVRTASQAANKTAAEAPIEQLRPIVQLPKYDGPPTSAILLTNEGRVIELKSGNPEAFGNYIGATHAEGKAALWIRENGSSGGIVFHNNPDGTCNYCNSHIPYLLPEGVRLWVVPPADAVAGGETWIDYPKPYDGNSAQPQPPKPERAKP